jgi:RAD51-like protein 2
VLKVALPQLGGGLPEAVSARQILARERAVRRIITFSPDLDGILGGGVAVGQITEFCGVPGVGKTQLGMQLAINVQLPPAFAGTGGEAVYIDTEGSFTPGRCAQMADSFCAHLAKVAAQRGDPARLEAAAATTRDGILGRIHLLRARDHVEQLAAVDALPALLDARPGVRLVVVDSVTFHFRQDYADLGARTRQLGQMAQRLMAAAGDRQVAVVLMNQVTTKVGAAGEAARLVPALGDSWAHAATSRVILYWQGASRRAFVYKSPSQPAAEAEYRVTAEGIRGKRPPKRPAPG